QSQREKARCRGAFGARQELHRHRQDRRCRSPHDFRMAAGGDVSIRASPPASGALGRRKRAPADARRSFDRGAGRASERPVRPLEQVREQIVGQSAYRLTGFLSPMIEGESGNLDRSQTWHVPGENPLDATTRTYAAIEVACLDLIGKTVGQPVCDLIGGRVRERVPFSAYPFYKHAGGGGEGDDARKDEYGEALSPE